jgi:hypothetical protein
MTHNPGAGAQARPDDDPTGRGGRLAALHNAAQAKRRDTVARLLGGIATLRERQEAITAKAIERETGLAFRTIQRNREAYELFRQHAAFFQGKPAGEPSVGAARAPDPPRTGRGLGPDEDPLLGYAKRALVHRCRELERRLAELERDLARVAARQQDLLRQNLILQAELTAARHQTPVEAHGNGAGQR